jgi:transposase
MTISGVCQIWEKGIGFCFAALRVRLLDLIATVIEVCRPTRDRGRGHPPTETIRVLATLRQFVREGTPWRSLRATADKASGSTLRRHLEQWAHTGVLAQVHAVLVGMLRGDPTLILDSCSVRAKRGGALTDPTDRAKPGTKYHVATTGDGVPVACAVTAANVNDTLVFERLFLAAFAVMARIRTVFADKGYDAERHRTLCRTFGAEPQIHKRGQGRGSAKDGGRSSAAMPGSWKTSAWLSDMTALASSYSPCSRPHVSFWLRDAWLANCENRL